jgi:O-antigen/teichoic acid export membrane protein
MANSFISTILTLLMFSFVAISSNYIFGTLLTANKSLKSLNLIALVGLVTNITINVIFIPQFMAIGSAWASLLAQGGSAILQMWVAIKIFKLKVDYSFIIKFLMLISMLLIMGYILTNYIQLNWVIAISIMLGGGLTFAFAIRLLDIGGMIKILKSDEL